jgi:ATP-dependent RNA helicase DeaD
MAAVKLYHETTVGTEDEEVIIEDTRPAAPPRSDRSPWRTKESHGGRASADGSAPPRRGKGPDLDMARIFIGAGREAGIRPQDLVGAIANEAGVAGSLVGAIQITDRFSLVEVPEEVAEQVIKAMGKANCASGPLPRLG